MPSDRAPADDTVVPMSTTWRSRRGTRDLQGGAGRPSVPDHGFSTRDWASVPPRTVRLDELTTTKRELALDQLLDEDSTFYGDLFPHAVQWHGEIYLEDGLHRALRAALQQRTCTSGCSTRRVRCDLAPTGLRDTPVERSDLQSATARRWPGAQRSSSRDDGVGEQPAALGEHDPAVLEPLPARRAPTSRAGARRAAPAAAASSIGSPSRSRTPSITRSVSRAVGVERLAAGCRAAAGVEQRGVARPGA